MPKRGGDASSEFRLFATEEVQKRLRGLPAGAARFIQQKLIEYVYPQLRVDCFHGPNIKKLRGYQPDTWRSADRKVPGIFHRGSGNSNGLTACRR